MADWIGRTCSNPEESVVEKNWAPGSCHSAHPDSILLVSNGGPQPDHYPQCWDHGQMFCDLLCAWKELEAWSRGGENRELRGERSRAVFPRAVLLSYSL